MDNNKSQENTFKTLAKGLLALAMLCAAFIIGMWAEAKSRNISYFPIENSNVRVFPYIGKYQTDLAPDETIIFQIESYEENDRSINRYMLNYWLDPQKPAQVGFVFVFNKPLDLSQFSHIRLECLLDEPALWIRVASNLTDLSTVEISKGRYGLAENAGEQEIYIPFSEFADTDWNNVLVLNFIVDSNTTFRVASKKFTVEKIEFVK